MKKTFLLAVFALFAANCLAQETTEKLDDYTVKITMTSVNENEGSKTTTTQEKNFTLAEMEQAKKASETALQTWKNERAKIEENILSQEKAVAMWARLIGEAKAQGVKPTEE